MPSRHFSIRESDPLKTLFKDTSRCLCLHYICTYVYVYAKFSLFLSVIQGGFALRYERRKEIISDEISSARDIAPFKLTPILVSS